jgi:hypothetical protein
MVGNMVFLRFPRFIKKHLFLRLRGNRGSQYCGSPPHFYVFKKNELGGALFSDFQKADCWNPHKH